MLFIKRTSLLSMNRSGFFRKAVQPFSSISTSDSMPIPNKLNLYGNTRSQPTRSVLLLLRDANVDHVFHHVDNLAGEHKNPKFKKILPAGLLPSIVTDSGVPIGEGAAILQYLVDRYNLLDWTSSNVVERAQINFWLHWNHTNTRNGTMQILVPEILYPPPPEKAAAILAKGQKTHTRTCTFLCRHFQASGNKFLVNSKHPSIADLMIVTELDQLSHRGYNLFDYLPFLRIEQYIEDVRGAVRSYDETFQPVADKGAEINRHMRAIDDNLSVCS
eukprot:gene11660-13546_t